MAQASNRLPSRQPATPPAQQAEPDDRISEKRTVPWPAIIIAAVTLIPAFIGAIYQFNNNDADNGSTDAFGQIAWRYTGVTHAVTAPPALSTDGSIVYTAPAEGEGIVAVDVETGRLRWAAPLGGATAGPVVAGDVVYVANLTGILFAVDPRSGVERWHATAGGTYEASPAIVDGALYIGNRDGHLYALDAASGQERWRADLGDWVDTTPAVMNGVVYVANRAGTLFALDAATGQERWRLDLGPTGTSGTVQSPAASPDLGIVAAVGADGILRVVDAATGTERWTYGPNPEAGDGDGTTARTIAGPPVIAHGLVFAGTADARLLALDAVTGEERWHSVGSTLSPGYAPVIAGDTVYTLHAGIGLFAFAAADGAPRWIFESETKGESLSPLTVGPTGDDIYFGSDRGILRAVEAPSLDT
jgi:outer membrane protein assembly factor BamB